jgi:hypothetical protein
MYPAPPVTRTCPQSPLSFGKSALPWNGILYILRFDLAGDQRVAHREIVNKEPLRTAAFLLDLDGVLIRSGEAHLSSYQRALEDHGLPLSPRAEELIAMGTARDLVLAEAGVPERLLSSVSAAKEAAFLNLMLHGETVLTDGDTVSQEAA